ncbi:MAG TPA: hypothetical protein VD735_03540 [Candidatus Saccharimonadales bacterium]|nr:hypothetical protein [Candidatus Saccharimonadales bacterium]
MNELGVPYPLSNAAFAQRRAAIVPSLEYFGFNEPAAILAGTGALALAGIDAHVPGIGATAFDLDVIGYYPLDRHYTALQLNQMRPDTILPTTLMSVAENPLEDGMPDGFLREAIGRAVQGADEWQCRVLHPADAVASKRGRGDVKDIVGVLHGHIVAYTEDHPLIHDPAWRTQISRMMPYLSYAVRARARSRSLPEWAYHLHGTNFAHPAFDDLTATL